MTGPKIQTTHPVDRSKSRRPHGLPVHRGSQLERGRGHRQQTISHGSMLVGHSPFSGRSRPANAMVAVSITTHEAGDARDGRDGGWRLPSMPGKKTQLTGTSTAQAQTRRCRCWWSHLGKKVAVAVAVDWTGRQTGSR